MILKPVLKINDKWNFDFNNDDSNSNAFNNTLQKKSKLYFKDKGISGYEND